MRIKKRLLSIFLCALMCVPSSTWSQVAGGGGLESGHTPRRQMATIVIMGLAGGILGLSTLSFYGRPQDYLSNIAIGFAIGVTAGTIYVTYRAARDPYDRRFQGVSFGPEYPPVTRNDWAQLQTHGPSYLPLQMTWEF